MNKKKAIHCWKCGKVMLAGKGLHEYDNKYLGHMTVPYESGELYTCDCGESPYLSAALSARIAEYEQARIEQLLLLSVGGDMHEFKSNLLGKSQLESELRIDSLDLESNPKYRNRIYHVVLNGDVLWWKPSVDLFRSKGDGRFVFGPIKSPARKRFCALVDMIQNLIPLKSAAMFTF